MNTKMPSQEDLGSFRRQLLALADRLSSGVARLTHAATRPTGAEGSRAEKPTCEPTVTSSEGDEEVVRGILTSEEELLAEVRAALDRFDAGTFGRCEQCGRALGKTRLQAIPYARACIRCTRAAETGAPG